NVWEWTRSIWGKDFSTPEYKYPYKPDDGREDLEAAKEKSRVLRGGSFDDTHGDVRCAGRNRSYPGYRSRSVGFRVLLSPF
ncbi:MAG: SUMF1/EgtB/PvdO family nonheme iron enzyme, partial [Colwellia sp.]|nr:SUMF1/EgtB/PvdO family nonheme iron enzyme [Colwellia sp.]